MAVAAAVAAESVTVAIISIIALSRIQARQEISPLLANRMKWGGVDDRMSGRSIVSRRTEQKSVNSVCYHFFILRGKLINGQD